MKGMGSKMKGLKMGFGKKKDKEDEPDKDKPDKTTGGIGSSAWRRRLEESAMQKLGLSKAEKDENTGDVDEELARFRATAADVAELLKRAEAYGNLTRSADQGRTRVIQRRFNVSVPRARVLKKASTLRDRSER